MSCVKPPLADLLAGWFATTDPAVDKPGAAVFLHGKVRAAKRIKVPSAINDLEDEGERARQVGMLVADWIRAEARKLAVVPVPVALVFELPKVYRRERAAAKGDPNKLFGLAMVGSTIAALLNARVCSPQPGEWCQIPKTVNGKLPKDAWSSPRGQLIKRRSTAAELACIENTHDAIDGTGLGYWALDRLDKVYPGAS